MGSFSMRTDTKGGLDGFFWCFSGEFYHRQRCPLTSDHQEEPYEAERKITARLCVRHWCNGLEEGNVLRATFPRTYKHKHTLTLNHSNINKRTAVAWPCQQSNKAVMIHVLLKKDWVFAANLKTNSCKAWMKKLMPFGLIKQVRQFLSLDQPGTSPEELTLPSDTWAALIFSKKMI